LSNNLKQEKTEVDRRERFKDKQARLTTEVKDNFSLQIYIYS
jgi:hypothetical protein